MSEIGEYIFTLDVERYINDYGINKALKQYVRMYRIGLITQDEFYIAMNILSQNA